MSVNIDRVSVRANAAAEVVLPKCKPGSNRGKQWAAYAEGWEAGYRAGVAQDAVSVHCPHCLEQFKLELGIQS